MRALYARILMGSFGSEKWGEKRGNGTMELEARSDCMLKSTRGKKIRSVSLQLFHFFPFPSSFCSTSIDCYGGRLVEGVL